MPTVLMIAFHFPPMTGSSGQMRTVSFANSLAALGWQVHVLTASAAAHVQVADNADNVSPAVHVHTALALDTARHLSIKGRYPGFLEIPDRWWTWAIAGVTKGLGIVRRHRPALLWATYPISTAQVIALALAKLTGLPLVADFRDPMMDEHFPREARKRRAHAWIEKRVLERAQRVVFTSPGTLRMYAERYPSCADKLVLIPNGYDESVFDVAEQELRGATPGAAADLVLTHAGSLYPKERDPRPFFRAVANLLRDDPALLAGVRIVLRGTGHDTIYRPEIAALGIDGVVRLEPSLPHAAAVAEMLTSDGLLLFQAASCNHQTPAKVYEYLRCGKPILALTDPAGDSAAALAEQPGARVADLASTQAIERQLKEFVGLARAARGGALAIPADARHGRHARAEHLQTVLLAAAESRDR